MAWTSGHTTACLMHHQFGTRETHTIHYPAIKSKAKISCATAMTEDTEFWLFCAVISVFSVAQAICTQLEGTEHERKYR